MSVRSTVSLERDLLKRVDAWAAGHNLPTGPGHRALAVSELLEIGMLAEPSLKAKPVLQASLIEGGADHV